MLIEKYYEQLKKLLDAVHTLTGGEKNYDAYFCALKLTAMLIFETIGMLVGCATIVLVPVLVYKVGMKRLTAGVSLTAEPGMVIKVNRNVTWFRFLFWSITIVVYIPLMIPTILFLL